MRRIESRNFAEFCLVMSREYPELSTEKLAGKLLQLFEAAQVISRVAEDECNRKLGDWEVQKKKKAQELAESISNELGFTLLHMSDARGYALKFVLPSGRYNSMGGREDGWGI